MSVISIIILFHSPPVESLEASADSLDDFMKGLGNQLERRKKVEIKHHLHELKKVSAACSKNKKTYRNIMSSYQWFPFSAKLMVSKFNPFIN